MLKIFALTFDPLGSYSSHGPNFELIGEPRGPNGEMGGSNRGFFPKCRSSDILTINDVMFSGSRRVASSFFLLLTPPPYPRRRPPKPHIIVQNFTQTAKFSKLIRNLSLAVLVYSDEGARRIPNSPTVVGRKINKKILRKKLSKNAKRHC